MSANCIWEFNLISCGLRMALYSVLWAVFQASAALARKKGKGLHKDMTIFWHKKKISEFPSFFAQSPVLCVQCL